MENNKYEFTGEKKDCFGITLQQIKRKSDGLIGGWIEAEENLKVSGNAWVFGNARVFGDATIGRPIDFIFVSGLRFSVTVRNDGYASIGCQAKLIADWLQVTFSGQTEICSEEEFNQTHGILKPVFELFQHRFEQSKSIEKVPS